MMIIVFNDKNCPKHLITATSIIINLFPVMMNYEVRKVIFFVSYIIYVFTITKMKD